MFRIFVLKEAYGKMLKMLDLMDKEIGALMIGRIFEGDAYVEDVVITKQSVTGASVEFDETGIDLATMQAALAEKVVIGWFHSHVNMAAFWSGTDMKTINDLIAHTEDYLVSIVSNKRYEHKGRIDYMAHSTFGVERQFVDDIPVIPVVGDLSIYETEIRTAIQEQVSERVVAYSKVKSRGRKGYAKGGLYSYGDDEDREAVYEKMMNEFDDEGNYIGPMDRDEAELEPVMSDDEVNSIMEEIGDAEIERLVAKGMSYEQASALIYG